MSGHTPWAEVKRKKPRHPTAPAWDGPVPGETSRQARQRRADSRARRDAWQLFCSELCATCNQTRTNVIHESDPETSVEGRAYYADFLDQLHEFVPSGSWR
jgi:hypothetical protein